MVLSYFLFLICLIVFHLLHSLLFFFLKQLSFFQSLSVCFYPCLLSFFLGCLCVILTIFLPFYLIFCLLSCLSVCLSLWLWVSVCLSSSCLLLCCSSFIAVSFPYDRPNSAMADQFTYVIATILTLCLTIVVLCEAKYELANIFFLQISFYLYCLTLTILMSFF